MITKKDLDELYLWAKDTKFPLKKAPTIKGGYCNKDVYISWLKGVGIANTGPSQNIFTPIFYIHSLVTDIKIKMWLTQFD